MAVAARKASNLGFEILKRPVKRGQYCVDGKLCVAEVDSYPLGFMYQPSSSSTSTPSQTFSNPIPSKQRQRMADNLMTGTIAWDAMCPLGLGGSQILRGPSGHLIERLIKNQKIDKVIDAGYEYMNVFESLAESTERAVKNKENILCLVDMNHFPHYFEEINKITTEERGNAMDKLLELGERRQFYSQIYERAVCHKDGGTVTVICQVNEDVPMEDVREMQSLSDGHLMITPEGTIDHRTSLSRFGMGSDTKTLRRHKMLQRIGSHIRTELCQFNPQGVQEMAKDDITSQLAQANKQILLSMEQTDTPVPVEEQIVLLVAASAHQWTHPEILKGGSDSPLISHFQQDQKNLLDKLRSHYDKDLKQIAVDLDMALKIFQAMHRK